MKQINVTRRSFVPHTMLAVVLLLCTSTACTKSEAVVGQRESVYDRVMRTKTIRAAWLTYPPAAMKDTTTGKLSGTFVETLDLIAKNLDLKVQWMDGETPWGTQIEGLEGDRYDIVGSPVWANYTRGKLTTLSKPVYYSGIGIYVRKNDNRFPNDWAVGGVTQRNKLLNNPDIRIATIDGETGDLIAQTQFPQAKRVALPQNAEISQLFLNVANSKADVLFAEPFFAYEYLRNNPGTVKNIAEQTPIRVLGNCYMMKKNEWQLKQMIDTAIEDMLNSGTIDTILANPNYEKAPSLFYRVALPYRAIK